MKPDVIDLFWTIGSAVMVFILGRISKGGKK